MPKVTESSSATAQAVPESKRKTITEWDTFAKYGFGVSQVVCQPLPGHPADEACKTRIIPSPQNIIDHINAGHGGGFLITLVEFPKTPFPWKKFEEAGLELMWIRDEVNDQFIDTNNIRRVKNALKPHNGKFRGAWQAFQGQFLFKLGFDVPDSAGDDDINDNDSQS